MMMDGILLPFGKKLNYFYIYFSLVFVSTKMCEINDDEEEESSLPYFKHRTTTTAHCKAKCKLN